jgi:hypothetical protein
VYASTERRLALVRETTLAELRAAAATVYSNESFATAILRGKAEN